MQELGGPDDWALPYWNYSYQDPDDPSVPWPRARLPWVFCQAKLPDGSGNPLYVDDIRIRGLQPTWPSGPQQGETMYLVNTTPPYAAAYGNATYQTRTTSQTGSTPRSMVPRTAWSRRHRHGLAGAVGHGLDVQNPDRRLDPIFWLHHSQVDRLWVGWNALGGPNPDGRWLTAEDDDPKLRPVRWNFWADDDIDNKLVVYPGEMVDPENLTGEHFRYSYRYQDLPPEPDRQIPALLRLAEVVPRSCSARSGRATQPRCRRRPASANSRPTGAASRSTTSR